jgi:hypothetical protein
LPAFIKAETKTFGSRTTFILQSSL